MFEIPANLEEEILRLKKEQNAVILAHFYQDAEIQDIADFVGDSLDLSRNAAATKADEIIFCGVKFMAEVAKILSPAKKVLVPDLKAGCSLEDSCQPAPFAEFKKKYPNAIVVSYINCSAEIKALSDIIVTSSNAKKIIEQIPADQEIIFAPDQHLGRYLAKITGREIVDSLRPQKFEEMARRASSEEGVYFNIHDRQAAQAQQSQNSNFKGRMVLWNGSCMVHEQFSEKELVKLMTNHPEAKVIAHPECPENLLSYANHIGSTSSLLKFAGDQQGGEFIVLTEPHIIHQMRKKNPSGKFLECYFEDRAGCTMCNNCPHMQLNTLEKLYLVMKYGDKSLSGGELQFDEALRVKAEKPLRKMLAMS